MREESKRKDAVLPPGLLDLEGPLELQVYVLVVVHEPAEGVVVTAVKHSGWGFLLGDWSLKSVFAGAENKVGSPGLKGGFLQVFS